MVKHRPCGINCRIRAGNTFSEISEMAGTSAIYIEMHYKHYDDEMLRMAALQSFRIDKSGIILPTVPITPTIIVMHLGDLLWGFSRVFGGGKHYNTEKPHSALVYRPSAPETAVPMDQGPIMH
jgi:hypothetical protein